MRSSRTHLLSPLQPPISHLIGRNNGRSKNVLPTQHGGTPAAGDFTPTPPPGGGLPEKEASRIQAHVPPNRRVSSYNGVMGNRKLKGSKKWLGTPTRRKKKQLCCRCRCRCEAAFPPHRLLHLHLQLHFHSWPPPARVIYQLRWTSAACVCSPITSTLGAPHPPPPSLHP